ncbi:MAG: permease, partial [Planctomycetota bacterium]|nr:permease [Planctomycetota bacterium]
KVLAYGVASVAGTVLAVCSCTVLPLFAGIWRMGAGLGPAATFLYSGPAINVLAIILTARILGLEIGIARAVSAILFSIAIGFLMHVIYRKEEMAKAEAQIAMPEPESKRPLWQTAAHFVCMIAILVFANWSAPREFSFQMKDGRSFTAAIIQNSPEHPVATTLTVKITEGAEAGKELVITADEVATKAPVPGFFTTIFGIKWHLTIAAAIAFGIVLALWYGVAPRKLAAAAAPAAILGVIFLDNPMMPAIAFAGGVVGFSAIAATQTGEMQDWFSASWTFAKQILPLLLLGVLAAGFCLGRPDHEGMIPSAWVAKLVGGNSLGANFFASLIGAFMYFATLTEVPILQLSLIH